MLKGIPLPHGRFWFWQASLTMLPSSGSNSDACYDRGSLFCRSCFLNEGGSSTPKSRRNAVLVLQCDLHFIPRAWGY